MLHYLGMIWVCESYSPLYHLALTLISIIATTKFPIEESEASHINVCVSRAATGR